jgi:hypothetical protein
VAGPDVLVLQAAGVALEGDDVSVVDEGVDRGCDDVDVAQDLAPSAELLVAGHDQRGALLAGDTSRRNRLSASCSNGM